MIEMSYFSSLIYGFFSINKIACHDKLFITYNRVFLIYYREKILQLIDKIELDRIWIRLWRHSRLYGS